MEERRDARCSRFPRKLEEKSPHVAVKPKSSKQAWRSLTGRQKLYLAPVIAIVLVGRAAVLSAAGLLLASLFVDLPRWLWLICFGASSAVLAGLLAEPYLRIFLGGGWMFFRKNIIRFRVAIQDSNGKWKTI